MLPDLQAIETTNAGRIVVGAFVRSTQYADVQGVVTKIYWTGYYYSIQVDNRHSDNANNYELISTPPPSPSDIRGLNPHFQQATSGNFEVLLPGENDRIYFADTAHQAICLVAAAIGLRDIDREVSYLTQRAEGKVVDELRWRGNAGIVGQLAYVSTRQPRPAPLFQVGNRVHFYSGYTTHTVSGLALYKDWRNYGHTQWHYFYEDAPGQPSAMPEQHTTAAPVPPPQVADPNE